jgi:hypothetical protein
MGLADDIPYSLTGLAIPKYMVSQVFVNTKNIAWWNDVMNERMDE